MIHNPKQNITDQEVRAFVRDQFRKGDEVAGLLLWDRPRPGLCLSVSYCRSSWAIIWGGSPALYPESTKVLVHVQGDYVKYLTPKMVVDLVDRAVDEYDRLDKEYTQCLHCGDTITHKHMGGMHLSHCFSCCFWYEWIDKDKLPENKYRSAVIDGSHWHICEEVPGPKRFRGMGGRTYRIRFADGTEVDTTNLWHQGDIPDIFRDAFPDNAEFVEVPEG